jgi:single-strand DNA-binding protein
MDDDSGYSRGRDDSAMSAAPSAPPAAPRRMEPKPAQKFDDMDDDIPF